MADANNKDCSELESKATEGKSAEARVESYGAGFLGKLFGIGQTARLAVDATNSVTPLKNVDAYHECVKKQEQDKKEEKVGQSEAPASSQSTAQKPAEKGFLSSIFDKMDGAVKLPSSNDDNIIGGMLRPNAAASGQLLPKPAPTPAGDPALTTGAAVGGRN